MNAPFRAEDLDVELNLRWEALYAAARTASEAGLHTEAIALADQAWALLPAPPERWSVAYITALRRIVLRFRAGEWLSGAVVAQAAADSAPSPPQVPVFLVKAGIGLYEQQDRAGALLAFKKAWTLGKDFGFRGEDAKYLQFLRSGAAR
jgi:tetratricopeptide (TPR) repeat protein